MNRRAFIAGTSAGLVTLVAGRALRAQQPAQAQPAPAWRDLRGGVGIFSMQGGTIGYFVAADAVALVDSQFPQSARVCADGLKQRSPRVIDVLINTHHHADHTGGNQTFQPLVRRIVAHANVPALQRQAAEAANQAATQAYADTTFATTWRQAIGSETLSARHYGPGHTGGDSVVFFEKANVVHMGDLMFNRIHPRIDRAAGASIQNWIVTLNQVVRDHDADTMYIFGHGGPEAGVVGTRGDLQYFAGYLTALLDFTRRAMQEGKTKEQIATTQTLPRFEAVGTLAPALSLGIALGVAFDELSAR
jgi:glyoxylase-like metal-dependent hydrolase (beta-lactamase superfamily II)